MHRSLGKDCNYVYRIELFFYIARIDAKLAFHEVFADADTFSWTMDPFIEVYLKIVFLDLQQLDVKSFKDSSF